LKKVKQRIAIQSPVAVVCLLLCALEVAVVDEAALEELLECVELVDVVAFLLAVVVVVAPVDVTLAVLEAVVDLVVVAVPVVAAPVVAAPVVVVVTVATEQWAELTFTVAL